MLFLQLLLLGCYLLDEAAAYSSYTADEEVQNLVFRKEERVVDYIKCLAQQSRFNHERYVCLLAALSACNDVYSVASECLEQLADDAGIVTHVLSHNGNGREVAGSSHILHEAH